ncbi:PadR family transcriptional regulator [Neorhizobium galegae]|uniref:PadR family transcriptional regulator n=1 Tax=Neorhizobium galegae TaxID=399 RepID=UPI000621B379|nr:PadR family transcriptional regulator [Neorhizobium galegae]CDZ28107.1 Putative transcriptional regulator [Neorhizobium galegae bv. officinalis]MCM2499651.1 PadR family transcriptional regulator [Neorhizobium galegae]MCQ1774045.1 PadR family transcriptional regulator [Neorhizobium galegae]MCQ1778175.1 PadR family transcriptional regulator [Neorhizobium galegae]MCQ1796916.1 PadR family transcriptional regulator [Neorhizobium galegae]
MLGHMRDKFEGRRGCKGREGRGFEEMLAMRGGPFSRGFGRGGPGGPGGGRGFGDDGDGRIGRFLVQGDLRLLVLALIEKEPRHGYEIIKHIEDLTYGFYAPSPGVVYPTLTYLDEAGYVVAEADGNKKRYAITEEGRKYLDENRSFAATILDRLSQLAERIKQRQERHDRGRETGPALPRSIDSAMLNLREVIARKIEGDEKKGSEIVRLLLDFAENIERDDEQGDNTQN